MAMISVDIDFRISSDRSNILYGILQFYVFQCLCMRY
uniref:Uncharacterized protein n=1 Tax=Anopheles minimus TaxID=112268 RepID=A0A182WP42_9DIPT